MCKCTCEYRPWGRWRAGHWRSCSSQEAAHHAMHPSFISRAFSILRIVQTLLNTFISIYNAHCFSFCAHHHLCNPATYEMNAIPCQLDLPLPIIGKNHCIFNFSDQWSCPRQKRAIRWSSCEQHQAAGEGIPACTKLVLVAASPNQPWLWWKLPARPVLVLVVAPGHHHQPDSKTDWFCPLPCRSLLCSWSLALCCVVRRVMSPSVPPDNICPGGGGLATHGGERRGR